VPAFQCVFPGCQSSARLQYRLEAFDVISCSRCGLRFRQPVPTDEEISEMYNDPAYSLSSHFSGQRPDATVQEHPEISIYR
jgi:transcription elongation factor Elf1